MEDFVADAQNGVEVVKGAVAVGAGWAADKVAQWKGIESKWLRVAIALGVFLGIVAVLSTVQAIF